MQDTKTKIYFASDFHLGVPSYEKSRERETIIVRWLDEIKCDAKELFLVGDLFDFWFEYKHVVPKGHIRFLGKLAELKDSGIEIHIFTGNHDMWMFDYLEKELNLKIYRDCAEFNFSEKKFLVGHGDGLGPGDHGYKFIKKIFSNSICQWMFARLHPNLGIGLANFWSRKSRDSQDIEKDVYLGDDNEWLFQYCTEEQMKKQRDFYVFGHRHLPLERELPENGKYINLGEWVYHKTYGVFDGVTFEVKEFK